jgi:hypothetical protein
LEISIPALTPDAPAFFKPFFLTMKLAPMKILDERASTRPLTLSEDMPSRQLVGIVWVVVVAMAAQKNQNPSLHRHRWLYHTPTGRSMKWNFASWLGDLSSLIPSSNNELDLKIN